jgi:hypothetical protein
MLARQRVNSPVNAVPGTSRQVSNLRSPRESRPHRPADRFSIIT